MSRSLNSPTGKLLRSSRLFSLPAPLPTPPMEVLSIRGVRHSDTATLPYPTHQAIATPKSSHARGDWGLKRPLPLKATRSSTPHIRVRAIDNSAHITDFESAADHTQSLAKWQEMNVVMRPRESRETISGASYDSIPKGAFDASTDNTALPNGGGVRAHGQTRWKSRGPWLARLSEDEFQRFVNRKLRSSTGRAKFLEYLATTRSAQKRAEYQISQKEKGDADPMSADAQQRLDEAARVSPDELEAYIRRLRDEHDGINSELGGLMHDFFDLPASSRDISPTTELMRATSMSINIASDGPPPMHPSAGLSYLRTDAYMDNHPNYGPQAQHPVIQARVIRPRNMAQGTYERAQLGVGGFVTWDPYRSQGENRHGEKAVADQLDLETEGGSKVWVQAVNAHVDDSGLVRLDVVRGNKAAIEVQTGDFNPSTAPPPEETKLKFGELLKMSGLAEKTDRAQVKGFDHDEVQHIRRSVKSAATQESLDSFKGLFDNNKSG